MMTFREHAKLSKCVGNDDIAESVVAAGSVKASALRALAVVTQEHRAILADKTATNAIRGLSEQAVALASLIVIGIGQGLADADLVARGRSVV